MGGETESTLNSTGKGLAPQQQGHWKRGRGQCDRPAQAAMQRHGRGTLKRPLWASPGVLAEDGSNMENRSEMFWGLLPAEALGKELELQERERSWWLMGV